MTDDEKINAFEKHFLNRQLKIAEQLARHFTQGDPADPLAESAFAILSIVTSYFETVEQFYTGETSDKRSKRFFSNGMRRVFGQKISSRNRAKLYSIMRCGMYHSAMPIGCFGLSRHTPAAISIQGSEIVINPDELVTELIKHFTAYIQQLRGDSHPELRKNMLRSFNRIASDATSDSLSPFPRWTNTTPPPWAEPPPIS